MRPSLATVMTGFMLLAAAGCSGGDLATGSFGTATSGLAPDTDDSTGGETEGVDGSSGGDDAGGGPPGIGAAGFAAAGGQASSPNYSVIFSMGQSSTHTSSHASPSYSLRGGLVGANGSPPQ